MTAKLPVALLLGGILLGVLAPVGLGAQAADQTPTEPPRGQLLRPGDVIQLRIWREPEWSGKFQVQANGTVVLPRLGEYMVIDETPATLEARLLNDYRQYLRNPSIEITVLRRINILGSVNSPGVYNVDPTVTIADAIAMAGGSTPIGNPDEVQILREGDVLTTRIGARTVIGDSPIRSGDQIYVPERSWLSRNAGVVATLISAAVTVSVALFLR